MKYIVTLIYIPLLGFKKVFTGTRTHIHLIDGYKSRAYFTTDWSAAKNSDQTLEMMMLPENKDRMILED